MKTIYMGWGKIAKDGHMLKEQKMAKALITVEKRLQGLSYI